MKKNPKIIAGIAGAVILAAGLAVLLVFLIPVYQDYRLEASLTPTPLPPAPGSVMAVTPDPSQPTRPPVIRAGARGQEVTDLQNRLAALGYYRGEIDGEFGPATREAVTAFQRANALDADGIVGEETRQLLYSEEALPYAE